MTFDTSRIADARIPVTAVELYLDTCAESFGVSPCTASGAAGTECYNTFDTCQDTANFNNTSKTYRFFQPISNWPVGEVGYPCLKGKPTFTPCVIDPKGSLGKRGTVSIKLTDFADDDIFTDPYFSTRSYTPELQGTFFGKLKARTPYYKGRLMKVKNMYIEDGALSTSQDRLYVIDSINVNQKGEVTITGKDLLKLADSTKAQAPAASTGSLASSINSTTTSIVLQSGEGADYDASGYVRIGDEVISYSSISTDTLNVTSRGYKSKADEHDADDTVQQCLSFAADNVVDIISDLLKDYAGIDESYIPYDAGLSVPTTVDDEWDIEKASWLSANDLTHLVTEPTGVATLLKQICSQNLIYMWFNEKEQEIKLRAIAPELKNATPISLTDASNILEDSVVVKDNDKERISQLWVYYDLVNIAGDIDEASNFKKLKVQVDTASENVNAYDEKAVKVIYANWLGSANAGLILTLAGRLLSRYAGTPKITKFKIDMKDADLWTGNIALLDTSAFQGSDGANLQQKMQVLKASEDHDKQITTLETESWEFTVLRYGFIAPNSMGDYTIESDANQNDYGFICDSLGKYSNGDLAHLIA